MSRLFAAILLFSSPDCPHEESSCITPTEYVEVSAVSDPVVHAAILPVSRRAISGKANVRFGD